MAFDTTKRNIKDVIELLKSYAQSNVNYYKLKAIKKVAKTSGKIYKIAILLIFLPLVLFFFSIAGAICIGNHYNDYVIGFAVIGGIYIIIILLALLLNRVMIQKPLIKKLVKKMLKEEE